MKADLEKLYGEFMQLRDSSSDYLLKQKYQEKLHALDKIFENLPYNAPNPANEGLTSLSPSAEKEEEKWISVEDRLPKEDNEYLVYYAKSFYTIAKFEDGNFKHRGGNEDIFRTITHWKHLTPPKN